MTSTATPLPGHTEHPETTCIHCNRSVLWELVEGAWLAYVDRDGSTSCPDPLQNDTQFEHEPLTGYNDGFAYEKELEVWLGAQEA
jgi:hypothetical protein